jgi:predicted RNase H-like nuclease (RuvC/YqgF family)
LEIPNFIFIFAPKNGKMVMRKKFDLLKEKEMIEWTTILVTLISSAIGAGAITSLVTMREKKKGKQLENKEKDIENKDKEQEVHLKLINELQEQIDKLNERLDKKDALLQEKDDIIADLRAKLDSVRTKCSLATVMRCESISCKDRIPPISQALTGTFSDKLQNYVEGLGDE